MPSPKRSPDPTGRPDIRPLGRTASRTLVTAALLFTVAAGVWMGYYFVDTASSPEVQARIESIQRLEAERDSVGRATEAVPTDVLQDSLGSLQDTSGTR